jgi:hypothetical protein
MGSFLSSLSSTFQPTSSVPESSLPAASSLLVESNSLTSNRPIPRPLQSSSLLFIDSDLDDYQSLVDGVTAGTEVYILDSAQDAVSQITAVLMGRQQVSSLHIVSHGEVGGLRFGDNSLNLYNLQDYASQIQSWSSALTPNADILLYGCNVAQGDLGTAFVHILSQLTGADVAASNDLTGSASLGGNWILEVSTGNIESSLAFQSEVLANYSYILVPVLDEVTGTVNYQFIGSSVLLAPNLTVVDPDDPTATLDGASINITTNFNPSQDRLGIQGQAGTSGTVNGLSWNYDINSGVLTFSGVAGVDVYQAALRQVTYTNLSGTPSPASRSVQYNLGSALYNPENGHFYNFVSAPNITWTDAFNIADTTLYFGLHGYLATITSASEQAFIETKVQGNGWIGASDAAEEGAWRWVTGPEAGLQFWQGGAGGSVVCGQYNNWAVGEPNNFGGNENYAHVIGNPALGPENQGRWNDLSNTGPGGDYAPLGYLIEYGGFPFDPPLQITGLVTIDLSGATTPPPATLSIANVQRSEGTRANKEFTFTVTLSEALGQPVTVNYSTADGTATVADNDYIATSGTLTFAPGVTSQTITVIVVGDSKLEGTERFTVNLSNPTGAAIANGTAIGSIGDDDGNGPDFDLDGNADVLWRNPITGENKIWLMNGSAVAQIDNLPGADSTWRLEGWGDFNDDGIDDLVWHNLVTEQTGIWLMNGTSIGSIALLPSVTNAWKVEKIADFTGDNQVDILWRNTVTGQTGIWVMQGATFSSLVELPTANLDWHVAAVGDLNGDNVLDILWRNWVSGETGAWILDNTSLASIAMLTTISPDWVIGDIADLDGDGDLDFFWYNTVSGQTGIWQMNGLTFQSAIELPTVLGWKAENIIDLEGNGQLEVFWRNYISGDNAIWRLAGTNLVSAEFLPSEALGWEPIFDI